MLIRLTDSAVHRAFAGFVLRLSRRRCISLRLASVGGATSVTAAAAVTGSWSGLASLFKADNYAAIFTVANRPRGYAVNILNGGVNNSTLVGVHGLKRLISTGAEYVTGGFCGKRL